MDSHLLRPIVVNNVGIFRIEFVYNTVNEKNPLLDPTTLEFVRITINGVVKHYTTKWKEGLNVEIQATSPFSYYILELKKLLDQLNSFSHKKKSSERKIINREIENIAKKLISLHYEQFMTSLDNISYYENNIENESVWKETAQKYAGKIAYYQGLLDEIGKAIGEEAYICDDGSRSDEVLRAKLPELVKRDTDLIRKLQSVFEK